MPLLQLQNISLHYGSEQLLDSVNFAIEKGERICLLGRNGCGKSSLLRLVAGAEKPDSGDLLRSPGLRIGWLGQDVPSNVGGTVFDVVREDAQQGGEEDWETDVRIEDLLGEMDLPSTKAFEELSGGMKRRAMLAKALACQPDLLLLDEPTNHIDLDSILRLESALLDSSSALLFVTHDRGFLRRVANRILELDRGRIFGWTCDYETFLQRKNEMLEAEETQRAAFEKKLALEEAWIRQGVKARRTRNEGRVRALKALRAERATWRNLSGVSKLQLDETKTGGQKVLTAEGVSFSYPGAGEPVIRDFSTRIWKGDKIGILGPNGCGKTTLLRLLLGQLAPDSGSIRHGTNLQILFLDQLRDQIDPEKSLAENVAGVSQTVQFQGRDRNIHSYLQDFLFPAEKVRQAAGMLSGGERNRLLLAKLFLQPANLLVLDEPTNDLDLETLELLEDVLVGFQGTLLLVSHDREFLDEVATSILVYDGPGVFVDIPGGYSDWLSWKAAREEHSAANALLPSQPMAAKPSPPESRTTKPRKFLNREQRELEALPALVEALETEQAALNRSLQNPEVFRSEPEKVRTVQARLDAIEEEISRLFARWEELEELRKSLDA